MIDPVTHHWLFARQDRQLAVDKITETQPRRIDIATAPKCEIHRHVEHVIGITLVSEAVLEHEREHAGAVRIGIGPDMASVAQKAVGFTLQKRRIRKQCRRQRLQRQ